jgi:hypothetical protein
VRYVLDFVTQALGPMYTADPDALRHLITGRRRQLRSRDDGRSMVDIADAASSVA